MSKLLTDIVPKLVNDNQVAIPNVGTTDWSLAPDGRYFQYTPRPMLGGTMTEDSNYYYHKFNSTSSLIVLKNTSVDVLVVGGGGGGGGAFNNDACGGGGGAGAYRTANQALTVNSYPVVIGDGGTAGAGSPGAYGGNGGDSIFNGITANGGSGGGASADGTTNSGGIGGSGVVVIRYAKTSAPVSVKSLSVPATNVSTWQTQGSYQYKVRNSFEPTDIANCKFWVDASHITGLNDGDTVTTWNDLSGQGNHITQATAGYKPIYKTNIINGKPAVRFDGTDDILSVTSADATNYTALTVITLTNIIGGGTATYRPYMICIGTNDGGGASNNPRTGFFDERNVDANHYDIATGNSNDAVGLLTGIGNYGEWKIISRMIPSISGGMICCNGVPAIMTNANYNISIKLNISLGGTTYPSAAANVDFVECMVFTRVLKSKERTDIEQYLSEKYNISLS